MNDENNNENLDENNKIVEEPKKEETTNVPEEVQEESKPQEFKTVDGPNEKEAKKAKKPKKPLGKRILHFIVGFIIYLVIVAVVSAIYFLWEKANKVDEDTQEPEEVVEEESLEWGDIYLQILEDEDNFKNLSDIEIALVDIAQDEEPELIVYGTKSSKKTSATIYNINSEREVDTVKFELKEDFNTEFLYDAEEDEYEWYIVTESETLYKIILEDDDYEVSKSLADYDDYEVVEVSEKTAFEPEEDDTEKTLVSAKKHYTSSEELITDYKSTSSKKSSSKKTSKSYIEAGDYKLEYGSYKYSSEYDDITIEIKEDGTFTYKNNWKNYVGESYVKTGSGKYEVYYDDEMPDEGYNDYYEYWVISFKFTEYKDTYEDDYYNTHDETEEYRYVLGYAITKDNTFESLQDIVSFKYAE